MADDWTTVTTKKSGYRNRRREKDSVLQEKMQTEHTKWFSLQEQVPFIVTPQMAKQSKFANFKEKFASAEWIQHQIDGWEYLRVMTNADEEVPEESVYEEFCALALNNKYGDRVLFVRDKH